MAGTPAEVTNEVTVPLITTMSMATWSAGIMFFNMSCRKRESAWYVISPYVHGFFLDKCTWRIVYGSKTERDLLLSRWIGHMPRVGEKCARYVIRYRRNINMLLLDILGLSGYAKGCRRGAGSSRAAEHCWTYSWNLLEMSDWKTQEDVAGLPYTVCEMVCGGSGHLDG